MTLNHRILFVRIIVISTILFSFSVIQSLFAQTANGNMVNAETLTLNQFVSSKTHGNTVEWQCVDESLTGKCIDYHNDQWYTFKTDSITHIYINISGQKCRDMRGVQLVVLTGDLCEPTTYSIYDCVSLATQDDIYVELDLNPNEKYWLNVDGYLHDFCSFFIEVSDKPKGFSVKPHTYLETQASTTLNIMNLRWTIPDSLSGIAKDVVISRKEVRSFRFDSIGHVPVQYNAYGSLMPDYQYGDTLLLPGNYVYRLGLVLESDKKLFIDEHSINVPAMYYQGAKDKMVTIPLDYRNNTPIKLLIINPENAAVLDELHFSFEPRKHSNFSFYINKYQAQRLKYLEVRVINEYDGYTKSHYLKLM